MLNLGFKFQLREESLFNEEDDHHLDIDRNSLSTLKSPGKMSQSLQLDAPLQDDGFGANLGGADDMSSGGIFEGGGLFDEPTMGSGMPLVDEDSLRKSSGDYELLV